MPAAETTATAKPLDPFDPRNFAVDAGTLRAMQSETGITPVLTGIKVTKPGKQTFVRVKPGHADMAQAAIHENEATGRPYLVMPNIAAKMEKSFAQTRTLRPAVTRQGTVFIWAIPTLDPDAKSHSTWHQSHIEVARVAETKWVRMSADRESERYNYAVAEFAAEPIWPDMSFRDLLELAFGKDGVISDVSHPVYRALAGLE